MTDQPTLKRSLGSSLLVLYGLGVTIGAGIFVLVGKVAGSAGVYAPVSFLLAAVLVGFSALSFGELSARFPRSAGEAVYVEAGFKLRSLALITGLLVVCAGLVSSATIAHGFVGYLQELIAIPRSLALIGVVLLLGLIAAWGIRESVTLAAVITLIEVGTLAYVVWAGRDSLGDLPARLPELTPGLDGTVWIGIFAGAVLAFYAFIGFEDMVNVAEEVKEPRKAMPRAILVTLALTTLLYMLVAVIAVLSLSVEALAASDAPIAEILKSATGGSAAWVSLVAIISVLNGALIQIIMASRVLYGLARQDALPRVLARIHPKRRTPILATALITALVLAFALTLPLESLARLTSAVTLVIFTLVNLALVRLKLSDTPTTTAGPCYPIWVPALGATINIAVLALELWRQLIL